MSGAIGPGSVVECVNNGPLTNSIGITHVAYQLTVGALYTVLDVEPPDGLWLVEAEPRMECSGFNIERFRIRPPRDWIQRLLTQPIPAGLVDA